MIHILELKLWHYERDDFYQFAQNCNVGSLLALQCSTTPVATLQQYLEA